MMIQISKDNSVLKHNKKKTDDDYSVKPDPRFPELKLESPYLENLCQEVTQCLWDLRQRIGFRLQVS